MAIGSRLLKSAAMTPKGRLTVEGYRSPNGNKLLCVGCAKAGALMGWTPMLRPACLMAEAPCSTCGQPLATLDNDAPSQAV